VFTGLIEEVGFIKSVKNSGDGLSLEIGAVAVLGGVKKGDSISINGACQTVTSFGDSSFTVFVSRVTASLTTLGDFKVGKKVNLERAMSPSSRFGGHIVQGHVDGKGVVRKINSDQNGISVDIDAGPDLLRYIVDRGSITVDGISLTVVTLDDRGFNLYLIPETVENTVIGDWKSGGSVNLEVDILAKYVEKMLFNRDNEETDGSDRLLKNKLMEEGFML